MSATRLVFGDAWERGYGDLEWRGWAPDRVMPWYFATYDGNTTNAYGVRTAGNALCFWQMDPAGISLWTDVRSGGVGVQLGERTLDVCDVMCRSGRADESAFAAIHAFCRQMCPSPRLPASPLYGSNDWYWAYGKNSAETVRADTTHVVELSPAGPNRPFVVIDDGWQPGRGADKAGAGTRWPPTFVAPERDPVFGFVRCRLRRPRPTHGDCRATTARSTRRCPTCGRRSSTTSRASDSGASI
jgi:alpha-galactosidase